MYLKFFTSFLFLCASIPVFAQLVAISGRISDQTTGERLSGASVMAGIYGTSTDDQGAFILFVQKSAVELSGLDITYVGYTHLHAAFKGNAYELKLSPSSEQLKTVVIRAPAETIVQRAYHRIPDNYIDKKLT